jgi:hypothetical protein
VGEVEEGDGDDVAGAGELVAGAGEPVAGSGEAEDGAGEDVEGSGVVDGLLIEPGFVELGELVVPVESLGVVPVVPLLSDGVVPCIVWSLPDCPVWEPVLPVPAPPV